MYALSLRKYNTIWKNLTEMKSQLQNHDKMGYTIRFSVGESQDEKLGG